MSKYLYIKTKKFPTTEEPNIPYIRFNKDNIITLANLGQIEKIDNIDQLTDNMSGIILHKDDKYIVIKPVNKKLTSLKYYCSLNAERTDETISASYDSVYYGDYYAYIVDYDKITNIKVLPDASYAFSGYPALFKEDIPQEVIDSWDMSDVTCLESFFGAMYLGEGDNCDSREMGHNSEHLDLSNWNVSNVENMNHMFYRALNLKTLKMPTCPMPKLKTMIRAFRETGLTELPLFDTSNVEDMTEAFCRNDNVMEFPLYDTSNVKNMTQAFYWNWNVTTTPQFDLSNVEIADGMFERCENLLSIAQFNTPKLRSTRSMFCDCEKLVAEGLKSFDTSNVEYMSSMFDNCQSLTTIPYFNTSKVKDVSWMFAYCFNLTSIPALDFGNVETMFKTFYCCNLTDDGLPQLDTSKVKNMEDAFTGCEITEIPNFTSTANVENMRETFSGTKIVNANCSKLNTGKVTNMILMFENCKDLTSVTNLSMNSCTTASGMFQDCTKLKSVGIFPATTSNLLNVGSMFKNTPIESLPQINTSNVVIMNSMFYGCKSLSNFENNTWYDTHWARNMTSMFENCSNLPKKFPYTINCAGITKADYLADMFRGTPVTEVTLSRVHISIKDKITSNLLKRNNTLKINFEDVNEFHRNVRIAFDKETIKNMYDESYYNSTYYPDHLDFLGIKNINYMFKQCSNLIEAPIFENTESIEQMYGTFSDCTNLVKAPKIESSNIKELGSTFAQCSSLRTVPEIDTSKCENFDYMFQGCTSLPNEFPWVIDFSSLCYDEYKDINYYESEGWNFKGMFWRSSVTKVTLKNVHRDAERYLTADYIKGSNSEIEIVVLNYI